VEASQGASSTLVLHRQMLPDQPVIHAHWLEDCINLSKEFLKSNTPTPSPLRRVQFRAILTHPLAAWRLPPAKVFTEAIRGMQWRNELFGYVFSVE
jgi:hypothetical protein